MYVIQATVEYKEDRHVNFITVKQLPTFYLDENVQGIVNEEHAERIALDIIDPGKNLIKVNMSVAKINFPRPAESEGESTNPGKEFFEMARMTVDIKAEEKNK